MTNCGDHAKTHNGNFMAGLASMEGYPVPVWDIVELIDSLPIIRNQGLYGLHYRKTMNDIYSELVEKAKSDNDSTVGRSALLCRLRTASRKATHELSVAWHDDLDAQEALLARQDAFAALHDAVRENL